MHLGELIRPRARVVGLSYVREHQKRSNERRYIDRTEKVASRYVAAVGRFRRPSRRGARERDRERERGGGWEGGGNGNARGFLFFSRARGGATFWVLFPCLGVLPGMLQPLAVDYFSGRRPPQEKFPAPSRVVMVAFVLCCFVSVYRYLSARSLGTG